VLALRVQVNEFPLLKAKCIQKVMLSEESAGPIQNFILASPDSALYMCIYIEALQQSSRHSYNM
jgi:hypothetical protein